MLINCTLRKVIIILVRFIQFLISRQWVGVIFLLHRMRIIILIIIGHPTFSRLANLINSLNWFILIQGIAGRLGIRSCSPFFILFVLWFVNFHELYKLLWPFHLFYLIIILKRLWLKRQNHGVISMLFLVAFKRWGL